MMTFAALYDIHGNLPALEAVLDEVRNLKVDQIIVGGDVVPGPMPRETLEQLLNLDCPVEFIYGNGEIAVLQAMSGIELSAVPERFRPAIRWTANQLSESHREAITNWPFRFEVEISDKIRALFCHATPHSENEVFTRLTPEKQLAPMFQDVSASLAVCGHTHMQFHRKAGSVEVINAGSVGMPFGKPGADWLLIRSDDFEFRHTDYALLPAAERVRLTDYPDAAAFAEGNILHPPTEEQMLKIFTKNS